VHLRTGTHAENIKEKLLPPHNKQRLLEMAQRNIQKEEGVEK